MWISKRVMTIARNGQTVTVHPGDALPEAATWPSLRNYVAMGHVQWKDDAPGTAQSMTPAPSGANTAATPPPTESAPTAAPEVKAKLETPEAEKPDMFSGHAAKRGDFLRGRKIR